MTPSQTGGWQWLQGEDQTASPEDQGNDLPATFARCFRGGDGERVLQHLFTMTLARALGADSPDGALRHLEGQRHLVSYIRTMVDKGRRGE